ncbi:hypothetical protein [Sphingomonas quercus]|uniref:Uncharacterized protein n=1 Tax=Sphingomonas quercus TaxID=2842451 RepID=A0ABS6BKZ2_9SPHN|nr:hypothetical protein [Sphingomonas quercus]MBU3078975.1 hypothetical protein [Sphingomonas quercus]
MRNFSTGRDNRSAFRAGFSRFVGGVHGRDARSAQRVVPEARIIGDAELVLATGCVPRYEPAEYEAPSSAHPSNLGGLPLWSGDTPPPEVGDVVTRNDRQRTSITVTGYEVDRGWLLMKGYQTDNPSVAWTLTGCEIVAG